MREKARIAPPHTRSYLPYVAYTLMGQQQLLLLVIGVVLVGLAVVAGFEMMQKGYRQDEADGLLDRSLTIATHAVGWKTRNDMFAGGNQSYAALNAGGLAALGLDDENIRGRYAITHATVDSLEITGVSERYEEVGVRVYVVNYTIERSELNFNGEFTLD